MVLDIEYHISKDVSIRFDTARELEVGGASRAQPPTIALMESIANVGDGAFDVPLRICVGMNFTYRRIRTRVAPYKHTNGSAANRGRPVYRICQ